MAGAPSGTSSSSVHSTGWRMNGSVCGPPSPPCEPISSSNAATSPRFGSYWLSRSRSGAWTISSSRLRLMIVCGPNSVVGSSPSTLSWSRNRVPFGPKTTAPNSFDRTSISPTPGCAATAATRPGWSSSSSSTVRRWSWPVNQTRPRLPEPTTAIGAGIGFGRLLLVGVEVDDAIGRLARERGPRDGRPDPLALGDLGQQRVDEDRSLGLGLGLDQRRAPAHQAPDVLAEADAVALEERLAEALPVIGQDDELVGPRRLVGRLDERRDRPVDAVERLERLDPLGPAVMGQLVVVGEVGVDDVGAAVHLLDDQGRVDVAQEHVAGGAHPGVLETAVHLRPDARRAGCAGPGSAP